ncbi:hypothetical protein KUV95_12515 [Microbulbifer agarilyticus]|uniref:hypothetical protein n=1 Tax=Microbulbifer agarilyticus TaxID=260552 RepID=UPI001C96F90F|nr:hypothetical protein [Microbulbifer agarilyticus]MBY6212374.1 hypothetical protein [Microbulbifer agarilyticus]
MNVKQLANFISGKLKGSTVFGYHVTDTGHIVVDLSGAYRIVCDNRKLLGELELHSLNDLGAPGATNLPEQSLTDLRDLDFKMVEYCYRAMPASDVRYYLNGLAVYPQGKAPRPDIGMAATDGHRLHFSSEGDWSKQPVVIPQDVIALIIKLKPQRITFGLSEDRINGGLVLQWHDDLLIVMFQMVDGKFPDIQRVIPDKKAPKDKAEVAQLKDLNEMVRVCKLTNRKYGGLRANGKYMSTGDNPREVPAPLNIDWPCEQGMSAEYLRDALKGHKKITLYHPKDANCSILLESDTTQAVVMPMRL